MTSSYIEEEAKKLGIKMPSTFVNPDYAIHKRDSGNFSIMYKGVCVGGAQTFERARELAEKHNAERCS